MDMVAVESEHGGAVAAAASLSSSQLTLSFAIVLDIPRPIFPSRWRSENLTALNRSGRCVAASTRGGEERPVQNSHLPLSHISDCPAP